VILCVSAITDIPFG